MSHLHRQANKLLADATVALNDLEGLGTEAAHATVEVALQITQHVEALCATLGAEKVAEALAAFREHTERSLQLDDAVEDRAPAATTGAPGPAASEDPADPGLEDPAAQDSTATAAPVDTGGEGN